MRARLVPSVRLWSNENIQRPRGIYSSSHPVITQRTNASADRVVAQPSTRRGQCSPATIAPGSDRTRGTHRASRCQMPSKTLLLLRLQRCQIWRSAVAGPRPSRRETAAPYRHATTKRASSSSAFNAEAVQESEVTEQPASPVDGPNLRAALAAAVGEGRLDSVTQLLRGHEHVHLVGSKASSDPVLQALKQLQQQVDSELLATLSSLPSDEQEAQTGGMDAGAGAVAGAPHAVPGLEEKMEVIRMVTNMYQQHGSAREKEKEKRRMEKKLTERYNIHRSAALGSSRAGQTAEAQAQASAAAATGEEEKHPLHDLFGGVSFDSLPPTTRTMGSEGPTAYLDQRFSMAGRMRRAAEDGDVEELLNLKAQLIAQAQPRSAGAQLASSWTNLVERFSDSGHNALVLAAGRGHLQVVKCLVEEFDADVNVYNDKGSNMTALTKAARQGHHEVVHYLLSQGADVNHALRDGKTALILAVVHDHMATVEVLVEDGHAAVNQQARDGSTALIHAALTEHTEAVEYLLQHGADVNHVSQRGTALSAAAAWGHLDVVSMLLDAGADCRLRDSRGQTALLFAAVHDQLDTIKMLIERGKASISEKDKNGRTALHLACMHGGADVTYFLVQAGVDVDQLDRSGGSALTAAVAGGHYDCVKVLLEKGKASLTAGSATLHQGHQPAKKTAVELAELRGYHDILEVMASLR